MGRRRWRTTAKGRLVAYFAVVAAGVLSLVLAVLWAPDRRPSGINNLKQLGAYLRMYRQENGDVLPPSLDAMYPELLAEASLLLDPRDTHPVRKGRNGLLQSYEYVGALPPGVHRHVIVCYSRKDIYKHGRIVIHYDEHVTFISKEDLHDPDQPVRKSLHASYLKLIEHIGDELTPERDAELRAFYEVEN